MNRGLFAALVIVAGAGCKKDDAQPGGPPTPTAGSASAGDAAAADPEPTPVAKAVDNPDWPCASEIGGDKVRFRYEGPSTCHAPPDIAVTGCPTSEEMDTASDGTIDRWRTFTYDAKGNLVTVEYRHEKDGAITAKLTATYTADGTPIRMDVDGDGDGKLDGNNVYERKGNTLVRTLDRDGDGKPDLRATTTFDADGHIQGVEIDHGADGSTNATGSYKWDGKRLVEEKTVAGTMTLLSTYLYSCP